MSENSTFGTGAPSAGVSNGVVYLSGSLAQPAPGMDGFATLPSADRPVHNLYISVYTDDGISGTLFIATGGGMEAFSGTSCGSGDTA